MKVGLIARAEDRGLGVQSWEFHRHVEPDRTLLVDMGELAGGFTPHPDRYPGAVIAPFRDGQLPETVVRDWLAGLDVVFTAETMYDWRLIQWADEAGVGTVVQANPEFYVHGLPTNPHPRPTAWWLPTPWRAERLPADARLVPVPVATDRFHVEHTERAGPLRVLHVVGHGAAGDRNGTRQLLMALRTVREPMDVTVLCQDRHVIRGRCSSSVRLIYETGGRGNYWELYQNQDVLALPRRYGGLCLPAQEAMAAGLAVVMTDCPPNDYWPPVLRVRGRIRGALRSIDGEVPMYAAHPTALASQLEQLASSPELLTDRQAQSSSWAQAHSWETLLPVYRAELAHAALRATR